MSFWHTDLVQLPAQHCEVAGAVSPVLNAGRAKVEAAVNVAKVSVSSSVFMTIGITTAFLKSLKKYLIY